MIALQITQQGAVLTLTQSFLQKRKPNWLA
jgi:hypothetical protein